MLKLLNMIYRSAKSSFQLGIHNIAYNTELWDSEYYVLSLSGYLRQLETDTKVLFTFFKHFTCFIKQHFLRKCPIEQFITILRVDSYV